MTAGSGAFLQDLQQIRLFFFYLPDDKLAESIPGQPVQDAKHQPAEYIRWIMDPHVHSGQGDQDGKDQGQDEKKPCLLFVEHLRDRKSKGRPRSKRR